VAAANFTTCATTLTVLGSSEAVEDGASGLDPYHQSATNRKRALSIISSHAGKESLAAGPTQNTESDAPFSAIAEDTDDEKKTLGATTTSRNVGTAGSSTSDNHRLNMPTMMLTHQQQQQQMPVTQQLGPDGKPQRAATKICRFFIYGNLIRCE
jgi:hypothetical protein